jgi:ribonuclease J
MYRAAKRSKRTFLEELYMADITSAIGGSIPNPSFDDVYAFITSGSRYDGLKKYARRMGKERIAKIPFVMCVRTTMLRYIKSLSKKMSFENGVLIYSFWSGYKETEDTKCFLSECENLGLKIVTIHTSGHADYEAIKKLVNTVNPDEIISIHTEAPEKMIFNT